MLLRTVSSITLVAAMAGCDRIVQPDLDPSDYVMPGVQFACQQWLPEEPNVELGLFDVYWGPDVPGAADNGPTDEHRLLVQSHGGIVTHEFNVRMIRVVIAPDEIPALGANVVHGVPLADDFPVDVFVHFRDAIDDEVLTLIKASGGRVLEEFEDFLAIAAVVPDAVIPDLRNRGSVTEVEGISLGCLEQPPAEPRLLAAHHIR